MRTGVVRYFLPFIFILCFSARPDKHKIVRGFTGTILLHDSIYLDETEISNMNWLEYVAWMRRKYKQDNYGIYRKSLPDTTVWRETLSLGEPYRETYFRHPAYREYPVVGITYEQAQDFCKWRTDIVNEVLYFREHKSKKWNVDSIYTIPQKVRYRLPTRQEWELAAFAGLDSNKFPLGYESIYNAKTKQSLVLVKERSASLQNPGTPWAVHSGGKNKFGFYNLIGNVSEMIAEKGICKGGSWAHHLDECEVMKDLQYSTPTAWLGFRCVMVMKEKLKN